MDSRFLDIDGLANFRDVGGLPTPTGPVRRGRLFRSDALALVTATGFAQVESLRCATVIDLRSSEEFAELPGPWPAIHVPLHEQLEELGLPEGSSLVGRDAGERWLRSFYELMLTRATSQFATVFETLADGSMLPAVVHCAGGKDRTGITVALVLSSVGVPRDVVLDDFALQRPAPIVAERLASVHARFVDGGIESDAAHGLLSAPRDAMRDALLALDEQFGGVDRYLVERCGISTTTIDAVRGNLVDAGP